MVPGRVSRAFKGMLKMNFSDLSFPLHTAHELQHKVDPLSKVYLASGNSGISVSFLTFGVKNPFLDVNFLSQYVSLHLYSFLNLGS